MSLELGKSVDPSGKWELKKNSTNLYIISNKKNNTLYCNHTHKYEDLRNWLENKKLNESLCPKKCEAFIGVRLKSPTKIAILMIDQLRNGSFSITDVYFGDNAEREAKNEWEKLQYGYSEKFDLPYVISTGSTDVKGEYIIIKNDKYQFHGMYESREEAFLELSKISFSNEYGLKLSYQIYSYEI